MTLGATIRALAHEYHEMKWVGLDAKIVNNRVMKTTVDVPESVLREAMGFTKATLIKHAGTYPGFMSADEVRTLRRKGS
jgi:hypothetical protein